VLFTEHFVALFFLYFSRAWAVFGVAILVNNFQSLIHHFQIGLFIHAYTYIPPPDPPLCVMAGSQTFSRPWAGLGFATVSLWFAEVSPTNVGYVFMLVSRLGCVGRGGA